MTMPETSPRRALLQQSLAENPGDPFLRYGLALQCLREGDIEEGRDRLKALIADNPGDQEVAAHQQLGQSYMEAGEGDEARCWFEAGIVKARGRGEAKAANEMEGFLALLG
jgi:thioredoxin-like negative regulator of GroEL